MKQRCEANQSLLGWDRNVQTHRAIFALHPAGFQLGWVPEFELNLDVGAHRNQARFEQQYLEMSEVQRMAIVPHVNRGAGETYDDAVAVVLDAELRPMTDVDEQRAHPALATLKPRERHLRRILRHSAQGNQAERSPE